MISASGTGTIGVLLSGGLDSCILLAQLLDRGRRVQPFYIRSGLFWQKDELAGLGRFLRSIRSDRLRPLVILDFPLADLYRDHWSVTGRDTPDGQTADEAVYLPGRNAVLIIKAALWCQLHGIGQLALATLATSPFADATERFFEHLQLALNQGGHRPVSIIRPFAKLNKRQVMRLGRPYPLQLTFSCIAPVDGLHCGRCNKCAERRRAFRLDGRKDETRYCAVAAPQRAAAPKRE